MRVLWLYGPPTVGKSATAWELLNAMAARDPATAVGKSTVGWEAFMATRHRGTPTAFVDLRQLGLVGVDGGVVDHGLQARARLAGDSLVGRPLTEAEAIAGAAVRLQDNVEVDAAFATLDTTRLEPALAASRVLSGRADGE